MKNACKDGVDGLNSFWPKTFGEIVTLVRRQGSTNYLFSQYNILILLQLCLGWMQFEMRPQTVFEAKRRTAARAGFTLMELLVVLAIIVIMATLVGGSISGVSDAGRVNRTVDGVSAALDQARSYAMGHNTYTWVGFYSDPATLKLTVATVAGTTGVESDLGASATFTPITKIQSYPGFKLQTTLDLAGLKLDTSKDDITASASSLSFNLPPPGGGSVITFSGSQTGGVMQFSPEGEASIGQSSHWIQIVLQPVRGGNALSLDPNLAVIQVARATGKVKVFRP